MGLRDTCITFKVSGIEVVLEGLSWKPKRTMKQLGMLRTYRSEIWRVNRNEEAQLNSTQFNPSPVDASAK